MAFESAGIERRGRGSMAAVHVRELSWEPPYDWDGVVRFLAARAIPGVELVETGRYRRTISIGAGRGAVEVVPAFDRNALVATVRFDDARAVPGILARLGRLFDLGAPVGEIAEWLAADPLLGPRIAARPGLRVPGAWDGFELAVRAVLGQQITVAAARTLAGRLAASFGEPFADPDAVEHGLTRQFPRPERLAAVAAEVAGLGMPRSRAHSVAGLAAAAVADPELFSADGADLGAAVERLQSLPGVGEWTAQYIALRALHQADAFPAADVGLLRAAAGPDGRRPTPAELLARAEAWRPWRAYAAQLLWSVPLPGHATAGGAGD